MRVLIIDDYADYALTLKDKFEFEGHEAQYCISSTKAVEIAKRFKPNWVVFDVRMPHKSGVSVYSDLNKEADFEFSAVFYSNHSSEPEVVEEFKNLKIPDDVIIPKTTVLHEDVVDDLIPALEAGYLKGGKKSDR
jgi:DNA-binding response OmpR family regulator